MQRHDTTIDQATLRRVQVLLTRALAEFDRVCRVLDIPYVVYGGTAIGAVRHQGFIPWDDDADVCMFRSDYERFLREAPAVLGAEYQILNSRIDVNYPNMFTKIGLKGTLFIPEFLRHSGYQMPIALDVFPLDNVPTDSRAYRNQARSTWFWGRLQYLQGTPVPYLELVGVKKALVLGVTGAVFWGMKAVRIKPRMLQSRWERAARRFENVESERSTDYSDRNPSAWAVSRDELFPAVYVPFENTRLPVPNQVDEVLRRGFGDYMALPPADKRKTHRPYVVGFGPYGAEN